MNSQQKIFGELVRIKTKDGLELQGLLFEPRVKTDQVIIHVHGWIGNFYENKFIDEIAEEVITRGIAFLTFNNRGAGIVQDFIERNKFNADYKRIGGSLEVFGDCLIDIKAAVDLMNSRGYREVVLQGHSLGCQKVTFYQSRKKDKRVKGLILLAPVDDVAFTKKHWGNKYKRALVIARKLLKQGEKSVPAWMAFYPMLTPEMFLNVADPQSSSGRIFDYSGKLAEIQSIHIPVLAIFGSLDAYQANPSDKLKILKDKLEKCDTILVEKAGHGFVGYEKELSLYISKWLRNL